MEILLITENLLQCSDAVPGCSVCSVSQSALFSMMDPDLGLSKSAVSI